MSAEWWPCDWRNGCKRCGRFLSADSFQGTAYTPYGPNFEYDGYTDFFACKHCGMDVEAAMIVTRVRLVDTDSLSPVES